MNKNTSQIFKYRMFVQARADLTPEEIRIREAKAKPSLWPWRDTGEFVFARRRNAATAFYREMRKIEPIIKIRAKKIVEKSGDRLDDAVHMRAWRGFAGIMGSINNASDEVRHFASNENCLTACGIQFTAWHPSVGKPQCPACLAAAVVAHPEMKAYL